MAASQPTPHCIEVWGARRAAAKRPSSAGSVKRRRDAEAGGDSKDAPTAEAPFVTVNVTSRGKDKFQQLSPFTPCTDDAGNAMFGVDGVADKSFTVEGLWQGLKVFEHEGIDTRKFAIRNMKSLKRPANRSGRGACIGHYAGDGKKPLGYIEARKQIYVPAYLIQLRTCRRAEMEALYKLHLAGNLALIDVFDNCDIEDPRQPLSHASIIKEELLRMFVARQGKPV